MRPYSNRPLLTKPACAAASDMRRHSPLNGAASPNVFPHTHLNCSLVMTSPKGRPKITTYDIREELKTHHTIPIYLQRELEVRLVIAFQKQGRQPRAKVPREKKQILANTRENKAHKVYLEVLDKDCHLFLPFLLATSPRACISFDLEDFFQKHKGRRCRLDLSIESKQLLQGIAGRRGFDQNHYYKKLIESIFPEGPYEISYCPRV